MRKGRTAAAAPGTVFARASGPFPARAALRRDALALGLAAALVGALPGAAHAQAAAGSPAAGAARLEGTVVQLMGSAEVDLPNDEALVSLFAEVQDAELGRAQSQANARVNAALAELRRIDGRAQLETGAYYSYPVYSRDSARRVVAWRVRQTVNLRTTDLAALPRTVATAQATLALGGVDFRPTRAAREQAEAQLLQGAIADLNRRVAAVAGALGVGPGRVRVEELNFGGSPDRPPVALARMAAAPGPGEAVVEPSFEPGRTPQQVVVSARVRLLPP